jgi:rhodanese-related sulfurtransferase
MERTIKPADFTALADTALVLDVRRKNDRETSNEFVFGALWKDPEQIDQWIEGVPKTHEVIIYCVRGGAVSNSVVDRLQADGVQARFIEGGLEGLKAAGGKVASRRGAHG